MGADLDRAEAAEDLSASYSTLFRELRGVFRSRGVPFEEAVDLAQETLVRTFVHLKRHGQTQPDLRPLAHTIAKRLYAERGRRSRLRFVDLPEAEEVADPSPEPVDQVLASERQRAVRLALRSLAPRHRRVVTLWMEGLRPADIAQELGIKRNAADALLHRARRQLAAKLEPSRATLGVFGLGSLKVRTLFRRVVDVVAGLDPSGAVTQATTGLAVAGLAAALMVVAPAIGPANTDSEASKVKVGAAFGTPVVNRSVTEAVRSAEGARVKASDVSYKVGKTTTVTNPATGDERDVWLDFEYKPEGGPLDPVLEPAAMTACGASGLCGGGTP